MPQTINNGEVRFYRHQHGDLAKYSCYPGYMLKPFKERLKYKYIRCKNGNWTDTPLPECGAGTSSSVTRTRKWGDTLVGGYRIQFFEIRPKLGVAEYPLAYSAGT